MRRGLIAWDPSELPLAVLQARMARLQQALRAEGLAALLAYTTIVRPSAVTYLTGFTPYWSEGLLYVPDDGEAFFATALSKRVGEWIGTTLQGGRVVNTHRPAALIAEELRRRPTPRLGVLDLDDLPMGHASTLLEQVPGLALADATPLFERLRQAGDPSEAAMISKALALVDTGFDALPDETSPRMMAGAAERALRLAGAEECYVTIAPDLAAGFAFSRVETLDRNLGATFGVRITVCRAGTWARRTRSFARGPAQAAFAEADAALTALAATFDGSRLAGPQVTAVFKTHGLRRWWIEAPRGGAPLATVTSSETHESAALPTNGAVLAVEGAPGGAPWCGAVTMVAR